jgi:hypothetical protein
MASEILQSASQIWQFSLGKRSQVGMTHGPMLMTIRDQLRQGMVRACGRNIVLPVGEAQAWGLRWTERGKTAGFETLNSREMVHC